MLLIYNYSLVSIGQFTVRLRASKTARKIREVLFSFFKEINLLTQHSSLFSVNNHCHTLEVYLIVIGGQWEDSSSYTGPPIYHTITSLMLYV